MSVVITAFEHWLDTVYILLEKYGLPTDIEVAVYRMMYDDNLSPEQAVREDACL